MRPCCPIGVSHCTKIRFSRGCGPRRRSRKGSLPMPGPRTCPITLTASDRHRLKQRASGHKTPFRDRLRALIVLLAARGHATAVIAARVGVSLDTARKWRTRFAAAGLAGLTDLPRSGRPRLFTEVQRAEVIALACELPAKHGVPLSTWTCLDLALEVVTAGIADSITASTVRRILADDAIKPWQHRSWISVRDPDFAVKAKRVLDLYARSWEGEPLGADDYVISCDEKTSIQARRPGSCKKPMSSPCRPPTGSQASAAAGVAMCAVAGATSRLTTAIGCPHCAQPITAFGTPLLAGTASRTPFLAPSATGRGAAGRRPPARSWRWCQSATRGRTLRPTRRSWNAPSPRSTPCSASTSPATPVVTSPAAAATSSTKLPGACCNSRTCLLYTSPSPRDRTRS